MLQTRVIPCLLLDDSRLVKTVKFRSPRYVGDPINAIKIYNEKEVDELIVLDITATIEKRKPPMSVLKEICNECFMPFTYGGGIRTVENMKLIFNMGIEKIAINSAALENPQLIQDAAKFFGSQSIVVAIDVKKSIWGKYCVTSHNGQKTFKVDLIDHVKDVISLGAGEIFLNSVDRDGTWSGFDIELIKKVSMAIDVPLIACGGAGSLKDISDAVKIGGASAVAIGSMAVYKGKGQGVLINFPKFTDIFSNLSEKEK